MATDPLKRKSLRTGVFAPPSAPAPQPTPVARSLQKGALGLRASVRGALGATGAAIGQEDFAQEQIAKATGLRQKAAAIEPGGVQDISEIPNILEDPVEFAKKSASFAGTQVVQNLPGIAATVATALPAARAAKGVARVAGAGKKAVDTATKVGAGTGVVAAVGAQETGEIFQEIAADPDATGTLQEKGQAALAGGTVAGTLELLPVMAVFNKLGVGKAAKKNILKRITQGAGVGALSEAPVEAAQTLVEKATHKFVNDNIELFDDEALQEYLNAAAAGFAVGGAFGGVGGAAAPTVSRGTTEDRLSRQMEDLEAEDELTSAKTKSKIEQIRSVDPEAAAQFDTLDPFDPASAEAVGVHYSKSFQSEDPVTRVARSFLSRDSELNTREGSRVLQQEVIPFIQSIIRGEVPNTPAEIARQKKVEEVLRTHFEREPQAGEVGATPLFDEMLQAVARFEEGRSQFTQLDQFETAAQEQEQGFPSTLEDRGAAEAQGFQTRVTTPENRTITLSETTQKPWRSADLSSKLAGKKFESTSLDKWVSSNNAKNKENIYRKVSYREYFIEKMIQDNVAAPEREAQLIQHAEEFAAEQIAADPRLEAEFDANDPVAFLDQFDAVETTPIAELTDEIDAIDLKQAEAIKLFRKESDRRKATPRGDFQIKVGDTTRNVNAGDLVRLMMGKVEMTDAGLTVERVGELFTTGVSSVINDETSGESVTLSGELSDELVVFTDSTGREYTYGEIKVLGSQSFRNRMEALRLAREKFEKGTPEYKKLEDAIRVTNNTRRTLNIAETEAQEADAAQKDIELAEDRGAVVEEEKVEGQAATPEGAFTAKAELQAKVAPLLARQKKIEAELKAPTDETDVKALKTELKANRQKVIELGVEETTQRQKEETTQVKKVSFAKGPGKVEGKDTLREMFAGADKSIAVKADKLVKKLAKQLGVKSRVSVLSGSSAISMIKAHGITKDFVEGKLEGIVLTEKGRAFIVINPKLKEKDAVRVAAHEFGHVILDEMQFSATSAHETAQYKAVMDSYDRWLADVKKKDSLVKEVAGKRFTKGGYANGWTSIGNVKVSRLPTQQMEYILSFHEWFAENVSKWVQSDAKPLGIVEEFFHGIAQTLKKFYELAKTQWGFITEESVADYLDSLYAQNVEPVAEEKVWADVTKNTTTFFSKGFKSDAAKFISKITGREVQVREGFAQQEIYVDPVSKIVYISQELNREPMGTVFNEMMQTSLDMLFTPKERSVLYNAFTGASVRAQLKRLLKGNKDAQALVEDNLDAAVAYGYQFWMAGELQLGPKANDTAAMGLDLMYKTAGFIQNHDQATEVLEAMNEGVLAARNEGAADFVVKSETEKTRIQDAVKKVSRVSGLVAPMFRKIFFAGDWDMRATKNAHLIKVADLISPQAGSTGKKEGMFEARNRHIGSYVDRALNIFDGESAEFGTEVLELLQNPTKTSRNPSQVKAVTKVRQLLGNIRNYATHRGVSIGDKGKEYFPWVFDHTYLHENALDFMKLLDQKKFGVERAKIAKNLGIEPENVSRAIYDNIVASNGNADVEINIARMGHLPRMDSANTRSLSWITELGNDADKAALAKFLNKNIGHTLMQYIEQTVKRAEYTNRFGADNGLLDNYIEKAVASGATEANITLTKKYIDAVMGVSGLELHPALVKAYEAFFGPMTQEAKVAAARKVRTLQGNVMVYMNFVLLGLSAFTSLADPVGIAVRSGDIATPWKAYKTGLKEVFNKAKGNKSELRSLAETLGTINKKMVNEALGQEFGGMYMTGFARKANEALFKYNGLQGITRFTRLMALEAGRGFITKHASGDFNKHSTRYLEQLNLEPADVKVDKDGQLIVLDEVQHNKASQEERDRDDRVRVALNRFVDESILRPNAAQRPIWASDPHAALVFHLKQYMYSFEDRILDRIWREMQEGNYAPFMLLFLWVPAMIGADYLRDLIQHGTDGNPRKQNWGPMDYASHASERAGIYGTAQILTDAKNDVTFGGIGIESFLGPTAGQLGRVPKLFAEDDNVQWNAFVGSLPGQNVYKNWDWGTDATRNVVGRYGE